MIKIALIGCGIIADQHVSQILRIPGCRIVGACDRELMMASQLCERFNIPGEYSDAPGMLHDLKPDVVHITTPAQSHFPLGKLCLEAGCHVYMEKPFTLKTAEAEILVSLAQKTGLQITVGHNLQFSPEALRMRSLVQAGFLGGTPVHLESIQCFSHKDPVYGKALLGDRTHWLRSLPGSLLQNLVSHGVARIAEFITSDCPEVTSFASCSPYLRSIGQSDIMDELRVIIQDGDLSSYFTFSTRFGYPVNEFRLFGPRAAIVVDNLNRICLPLRDRGFKSFMRYFFAPLVIAKSYAAASLVNGRHFLRKEFHESASMKNLFEAFYASVLGKGPPPIPSKQILITSRIMDMIFAQIRNQRPLSLDELGTESNGKREPVTTL